MKKTFKTILSFALALILCVSLCAGAFADGEQDPAPTDPEPTEPTFPTTAYITKQLDIASMTTVPGVTFTFSFAGNTAESIGLQANEQIPAITAVSVTYSSSDGSNITTGSVDKTVQVVFPTYTHAGVYAYNVTESNNFTDTATEVIVNDTAYYIMRVYVENTDAGLAITAVTAEKFEDADDDSGEKVEITDNTEGDNDFRFENNYNKISENPDPEGDEESLKISKTVAGNYGDKTKAFSYSITVTAPENALASFKTAGFTYSINGATAVAGAYDTAITFTLKHGENFELFGVLTGSTYDVTETGETDYTAKADVVVNGGDSANEKADEGEDLELEEKGIGEKTNTADFTNTYDDESITPTGIVINNLPYVMLAVVAVAGLFFLVAASKRKAQED